MYVASSATRYENTSFDRQHFRLMAALGGGERSGASLLDSFVRSVPAHLSEIVASVWTEDAPALRSVAGGWRPVAVSIGALDIATCLDGLERCGAQGDLDEAGELVQQLTGALETAIPMIRAEQDRLQRMAAE